MFQASNTWIRTLAQRHRFVLRASGGFIKSDDFDAVPPDLRFFAGGDHSIRGYDYKSISPKNSAGELTGASKMLTGTLEYQYNIKGKWWGAIFMDAGDAIRDMSQFDLKTGFGVGIRCGFSYRSGQTRYSPRYWGFREKRCTVLYWVRR